ncbi:NUDIX domain-containing protein [Nocardioides ferulae]|uniref:NUDIX domain-containing protein n=1 Tax=Nocardioides ferulae TaxID=2340821 RepID=UPI000EB0A5C2|nr:NUDIX hydrolase [Nocardioides ferulae]
MWASCDAGHTHWGRHGAAGVLVRHAPETGPARYLLQHRARGVHHGGTWGVPGGAVERGETPEQAAWREAWEELGLRPDGLRPVGSHLDDHGGWSYHTLVVDSPTAFPARGLNFETGPDGCRWFTAHEVGAVTLHPGLAAAWPHLMRLAP